MRRWAEAPPRYESLAGGSAPYHENPAAHLAYLNLAPPRGGEAFAINDLSES